MVSREGVWYLMIRQHTGYWIRPQVVVTDNIRGSVYEASIDCWLIDSDDGKCDPVDPWYHDFGVTPEATPRQGKKESLLHTHLKKPCANQEHQQRSLLTKQQRFDTFSITKPLWLSANSVSLNNTLVCKLGSSNRNMKRKFNIFRYITPTKHWTLIHLRPLSLTWVNSNG